MFQCLYSRWTTIRIQTEQLIKEVNCYWIGTNKEFIKILLRKMRQRSDVALSLGKKKEEKGSDKKQNVKEEETKRKRREEEESR